MSTEMYEVMEVKGKPGLTVGSNVLKPGQRFTREDWNFPQLNLDECLKTKRCKKIVVSEKADKKSSKKDDKKTEPQKAEAPENKDSKAPEEKEKKGFFK